MQGVGLQHRQITHHSQHDKQARKPNKVT